MKVPTAPYFMAFIAFMAGAGAAAFLAFFIAFMAFGMVKRTNNKPCGQKKMKWSYIIKLQSVENGNGCVPINMFKFLCGNSGAYSCATKRANDARSNTRTQNVYAVVHFDAFHSVFKPCLFSP